MNDEVEVNVSVPEPTERASASLFDGMRRLVLASIGAAAITRDEVEKVVSQLVERGELAQKDGEKLTQEMGLRMKQARFDASDAGSDISRQVENGVEQFLNRLNVPSKRDIDDLSTKLAQLSARVEELRKAQESSR
ncbi:MAG: phasin family protein [Roseiflexaceae bacterium]|nr:phasin family protein [Roseiflexaceae bacterium]